MRDPASITVRELWRYPVKSMGGHRVASAPIDARGLHADRLWAVRDLELGATTTARRLPALMGCSARFAAEPPADAGPGRAAEVIVTFPDGEERSSSDPAVHVRLSELVGRRVELRPLPAVGDRHEHRGARPSRADLRRQFGLADDEPFPDFSEMPVAKLVELARYATPRGSFADAYPVHLLGTGSLAAMRELAPSADFDVRRFRPTVVLEAADELGWCGSALRAGPLSLDVVSPTVRCSMPVREQPGLPAQPDVLRTINRHSRRCLGVYAEVRSPGRLAEGDELVLERAADPGGARRVAGRLKRRVVRASTRAAFRP